MNEKEKLHIIIFSKLIKKISPTNGHFCMLSHRKVLVRVSIDTKVLIRHFGDKNLKNKCL